MARRSCSTLGDVGLQKVKILPILKIKFWNTDAFQRHVSCTIVTSGELCTLKILDSFKGFRSYRSLN